MKNKFLNHLKNYSLLIFSSALYAASFAWFYQPNAISIGGFTGIGQILNYIFPLLPIGMTTLVLNIPLFAIAIKKQGIKFLLDSLLCMVLGSVFVDIVNRIYVFEPMQDKLLAVVCGGFLVGTASGIQMRLGATNGGSELTARLLKYKFSHISVGKLCLMVDLTVIISCAVILKQIYSALYGIVSMYISSIAVDFVVYGGTKAKMAYIISDNSNTLKEKLLSLNLGITLIDSHGGFKDDNKRMILCAFRPQRIATVKSAVHEIDPNAFVIVCDTHEILGEGFGYYSPNEL